MLQSAVNLMKTIHKMDANGATECLVFDNREQTIKKVSRILVNRSHSVFLARFYDLIRVGLFEDTRFFGKSGRFKIQFLQGSVAGSKSQIPR